MCTLKEIFAVRGDREGRQMPGIAAFPQTVEKFDVFNHSRKFFPSKSNFQHKAHIFYAAVANKKRFSAVPKLHCCNQIEPPSAVQELRRNKQRKGRRGSKRK